MASAFSVRPEGGARRRMGRDKALLPHPDGGVWLTAIVHQLLPLERPIQVVSRHQAHADQLPRCSQVSVLLEPPPWNGPLNALARVLPSTPGQALLVVPVDMPRLKTDNFRGSCTLHSRCIFRFVCRHLLGLESPQPLFSWHRLPNGVE